MFLFSVTIDQEEQMDGFETWEGLIERLRRFNVRHFDTLERRLDTSVTEVKELIEFVAQRDQAQDREDKEKQNRMIYSNQVNAALRFDEMADKLNKMQDQMPKIEEQKDENQEQQSADKSSEAGKSQIAAKESTLLNNKQ